MITISIDVTLLQKHRFKTVTRKNGKVAQFCDLVLIDTPNSQHGDFIVKQGTTAEERAARVDMPILGNGKIFEKRGQQRQAPKEAAPPPGDGDDVPF